MKNPCFNEETRTDCPKRHAGCAVDCPDWAAYVKERDEEYARRKNLSAVNCAMYNSRSKLYKKIVMGKVRSGRSHRRGGMD